MKLTPISRTENIVTFRVEGVDAAYVNTLRRVMMTEVPTLAIERIEFSKNNSVVYDEMLAHRLGLVPLTSDIKSYQTKENHGEAGNPSNEVQLVVKMNKVKGSQWAKASDMVSSDPKVQPVHPEMPLVKLLEGQDLEFVAYAELGTGKEHMKWSPCLATYNLYPHIQVIKQPRNPKRVAERYPGVFELKGDKLVVAENGGAFMPDVELDLDDGEATIEHKNDYVFTVESWGQLTPDEIVEEAVRRYSEQLDTFANSL